MRLLTYLLFALTAASATAVDVPWPDREVWPQSPQARHIAQAIYLTDYQGNNIAVVDAGGSITQRTDYYPPELTFVGHSQGGGQAAAASMATGRKAITFNPASVSLCTKLRFNLSSAQNITNYRTVGYYWKSDLFHSEIIIGGDPLNNIQDNLGLHAPGNTKYIIIGIMNPLKSHSINTIIDNLK